MIMLQPQATYTSLISAQAEDTRSLSLGELGNDTFEFVIFIWYHRSSQQKLKVVSK